MTVRMAPATDNAADDASDTGFTHAPPRQKNRVHLTADRFGRRALGRAAQHGRAAH
ncbi:MAG: hypothetical protein WCD21_02605 [Streptomyces sp.]